MIKRDKHHFCGKECKFEYWRKMDLYVGKDNPAWKGGFKKYYGPDWQKQRENARKRDNYTCQLCKKREDGQELDVHHIVSFREFGLVKYKEANQLNNLTTLCHSCHSNLDWRS